MVNERLETTDGSGLGTARVNEKTGVIRRDAKLQVKQLPSAVYWSALRKPVYLELNANAKNGDDPVCFSEAIAQFISQSALDPLNPSL